jgi:hypothetical protein
MALNFNARIDEDNTRIEFRDESASIEIVNADDTSNITGGSNSIYFLIKGQKLVYIGKTDTGVRRHADKEFDTYIIVSAPTGISIGFLEYKYIEMAKASGIELINTATVNRQSGLSVNKEQNAEEFIIDTNSILKKFGYDFFKEKGNRYNQNRPLSNTEKSFEYMNYRVVTIGGRITEIYIAGDKYEGNMSEKLREIADEAGVDYSGWKQYKLSGPVHFAYELGKCLKERERNI